MIKRIGALLVLSLLALTATAQTRTQQAVEDFNEPALTADWDQTNSDNGSLTIDDSTVATGSSFGNHGAARWVGSTSPGTFTDDQYSSVQIFLLPSGTPNYGFGVICRASADDNPTRDYYYALVSDETHFGKVVNGTDTELEGSGTPTWTDGDRIEIECYGTTIRVLKNGTPLGGAFTATDASIATGAPGAIGIGDPTDLAEGDNWVGGSIVVGGGGGTVVNPITGKGGAAAQPIVN